MKNHVGRPSNEELKSRRNKKIIAIVLPIIVVVVVALLTSGTLSNLMGNSVYNKVYCEEGYKPSGNKCVRNISTPAIMIGDVNKDNTIDANDILTIQNYISRQIKFDEHQVKLADVNNDNKINIRDVATLQKYISNSLSGTLIKQYRIGEYVCPREYKQNKRSCTQVLSKSPLDVNTLDYKIGDKITYKGISFQVVKNTKKTDSTLTLIKTLPLSKSDIVKAMNGGSSPSVLDGGVVTLEASENVNSNSGAYVTIKPYASSIMKTILTSWASKNSLLATSQDKVRLLTDNEIENNLNYDLYGAGNELYVEYDNTSFKWDAVEYWTLTGDNVILTKFFSKNDKSLGLGAGPIGGVLQPVIKISKSNINK